MSERPDPTSYFVFFDCLHTAWVLPDEYGDGSAWCDECEKFQVYDVARAEAVNGR